MIKIERTEDLLTDAELTVVIEQAASANDFSGVVRLTRETSVEFAFGLANRSTEVANLGSTSFAIASGTKFLTALAIGRLIDAGAATLESRFVDLISRGLRSQLQGISEKVTLANLLSHTSGVYDYYDEELITDFDAFEMPIPGSKLVTVADYLPMLDGPMKFEPGKRFSYSNGGYVLLGLVIEALSGNCFQQFIQTEIFERLAMTGSGFFRFDALPSTAAVGYLGANGETETNESKLPVIGGPDGGAFTTAVDIERLWSAFLEHRVISKELTEHFVSPISHCKDSIHYGCGLWIDKSDPRRLYLEGSDAGVSFVSLRFADQPTQVGPICTVISNTSDGAWPMSRLLIKTIRQCVFAINRAH